MTIKSEFLTFFDLYLRGLKIFRIDLFFHHLYFAGLVRLLIRRDGGGSSLKANCHLYTTYTQVKNRYKLKWLKTDEHV